MQQSISEIQKIAYLIDFYREQVGGKNSKNAKAIEEYLDAEDKKMKHQVEAQIIERENVSTSYDITIPDDLENKLKVNEQLLGHFYFKIANRNADIHVLNQLYADYYDETIYSSEEETFLLEHFKEVTNYIIKTSFYEFQEYDDLKDAHIIPSEVLDLIANQVEIPQDAVIYNPFCGFCQLAVANNTKHFICEESYTEGKKHEEYDYSNWLWAWMQVAIYANNIDAEIINGEEPSSYNMVFSYIPYMSAAFFGNPNNETLDRIHNKSCDVQIVNKLLQAYKHLGQGGKMVLLLPDFLFVNNGGYYPLRNLWEQTVEDCSLSKIIQLPAICNGLSYCFCLVIIEKNNRNNDVTMIDARFAAKKNDTTKIIDPDDFANVFTKSYTDNLKLSSTTPNSFKRVFVDGEVKMIEEFGSPFFQTIDNDKFSKMLHNDGIERVSGSRKMVSILYNKVNTEILLPQIYTIERPDYSNNTISLSELCSYSSTRIRDIKTDLPEDTRWIKDNNLHYIFGGLVNLFELEEAKCPNNPPHTNEFTFTDDGELYEEYLWSQTSTIGRRVCEYRRSTYLDASNGDVLIKEDSYGKLIAVVSKESKAMAVDSGIKVFCPKEDSKAFILLAVLRMPIVYRQIQAYEKLGLSDHLDDIIVPYDKWLIDNEVSRLLHEEEMTNVLRTNYENIKKSVRMRKHALTQSLSSIEAMFYALNAYRIRKDGNISDEDIISRVKGTTVSEAFEFLSNSIEDMMPALEHIAEVEYIFSDPEWINPEAYIENYISINEKGWLNFKPIVTWDPDNNLAQNDILGPSQNNPIVRKGEVIRQLFFPKDALDKIFGNIISNAQSYGFTEESRKDYQLKFSWHMDGTSLIVEIENNGTPIPDDRDTASLLEYGVSTALHHNGHNGIGCNEIDDIMRRYDGKVEIVSSPEKEYTVKYILTFNRSNFARTF